MLGFLYYIFKHEGAFVFPLVITSSPLWVLAIMIICEIIQGTITL